MVEVESLIAALKAAGKDFESKIYADAPGGHGFNRIDTPLARDEPARDLRLPRQPPQALTRRGGRAAHAFSISGAKRDLSWAFR